MWVTREIVVRSTWCLPSSTFQGILEGRHNLFNCLLITICVPSVTREGLNVSKYFTAPTPGGVTGGEASVR